MKKSILFIDPLPHGCQFTPQMEISGYNQIINHVDKYKDFITHTYDYCKVNRYIAPKSAGKKRIFPILPRGIPYLTSLHYTNPIAEILALKKKPEIIHHINADNTLFLHGLLGKKIKSRIIATVHQPIDSFLKIMPRTWIKVYNGIDTLITIATREYEFFKKNLNAKVVKIPHGNNNHLFPKSELKEDLGICIGGWLRDLQCLESAMRVVEKNHPNFRLIVVSRRKPKNFTSKCPNIIYKFNVSDKVLMGLYQKASILVLPLKDCTANNAILESLASGIPIITNKVGGVLDYVNNDCASFFRNGDHIQLEESISYLLDNQDELKRRSKAALKKSMEFDWGKITKRIVDEIYLK